MIAPDLFTELADVPAGEPYTLGDLAELWVTLEQPREGCGPLAHISFWPDREMAELNREGSQQVCKVRVQIIEVLDLGQEDERTGGMRA